MTKAPPACMGKRGPASPPLLSHPGWRGGRACSPQLTVGETPTPRFTACPCNVPVISSSVLLSPLPHCLTQARLLSCLSLSFSFCTPGATSPPHSCSENQKRCLLQGTGHRLRLRPPPRPCQCDSHTPVLSLLALLKPLDKPTSARFLTCASRRHAIRTGVRARSSPSRSDLTARCKYLLDAVDNRNQTPPPDSLVTACH